MRPLVFAALIALAFVPLEHVFQARPSTRRTFAADAGFATFGAILTQVGLAFGAGIVLRELELFAPDRSPFGHAHPGVGLAASLVLFEFGGYVYHRLAHRVPWLWRFHEVHHSSESLDFLAGFRQHPVEIVLMTLAQNAPLVLLGIPIGVHATLLVLLKVNTIFVHSNLDVRIGALRYVLATPRFHHRHHARDGASRNFASMLPLFDHLFGTASDEAADRFGLCEPMPTSFAGLLARPFRRRSDPAFEMPTPRTWLRRVHVRGRITPNRPSRVPRSPMRSAARGRPRRRRSGDRRRTSPRP